jgi:hypothetical protein
MDKETQDRIEKLNQSVFLLTEIIKSLMIDLSVLRDISKSGYKVNHKVLEQIRGTIGWDADVPSEKPDPEEYKHLRELSDVNYIPVRRNTESR